MNELISVIVPVYNVEKYLRKCIESIINQTYKNLEIILVDDGSTDNSGKICDEYSKKDARIKVIHKKNGGVSDTRNVALKTVTGEYILFVDSDDFIDKSICEVLISNIGENDFIQCGYIIVSKTKNVYISKVKKENHIDSLYEMLVQHLKSVITPTLWAKLYRKQVFDNIVFPTGRVYEDAAVLYKILENCSNILLIPDTLYYWRMNSLSITHTRSETNLINLIEYSRERIHYLISKYDYLTDILYNDLYRNYVNIYSEMKARNHSKKILNEVIKCAKTDYVEAYVNKLEPNIKKAFTGICLNKNNYSLMSAIFEQRLKILYQYAKDIFFKIFFPLLKNKDYYDLT